MRASLRAVASVLSPRKTLRLKQLFCEAVRWAPIFISVLYAGQGSRANDSSPVRIGIVAYEDFGNVFETWERIFRNLSVAANGELQFQVAAGTYGDLIHWMDQRLIDVAVVTPGVFGEAIHLGLAGESSKPFSYEATMSHPPAASHWAAEERKAPGQHFDYRTVCAVAEDSPLRTLEDLKLNWEQIRVLFVHPLSVSGRVAPEFALRESGLPIDPRRVEYTHSHSETLRLLADQDRETLEVGFVWDDSLRHAPSMESRVRRIPFPVLDMLELPQLAIVVRRDFPQQARLQELFANYRDEQGQTVFRRLDDWEERYGNVVTWSNALNLSSLSGSAQDVSLDEIGNMLLHSCRSRGAPPRIALVMSGGGAKCSYQVGAVSALEEKLAQLRNSNPDCPLDIHLVVGTSGGAINSTPVAMGVTASPSGRRDLQRVWTSLDQRDLVRPSWIVKANIGVWFAIFLAWCWLWIVRRMSAENRWTRYWALGLIALAIVQFLLAYGDWSPWQYLGKNHWWHHAWLWGDFGFATSAWCLIALAIGVLLLNPWLGRRENHYRASHRWIGWVLTSCLFGLPLAQLLTVLFFQETLSTGEGMESALARHMPVLIDQHLSHQNQPGLALPIRLQNDARLHAASRQIFERDLIQRDLVITGNCLDQTSHSLPSDLYFYVKASPDSPAPPFSSRGIDLRQRPELLLDVVLGSGTIFPVFPSRTLHNFPSQDHRADLVDGGFAHNSPIEAAVLWGATHVFLIEATPQRRLPRNNFAENAAAAFVHLHRQTQLVDARSKKQVVVFTLAPEPPHLCVLDFADNLLAASIQTGYDDARRGSHFRKELGEPVFAPIE